MRIIGCDLHARQQTLAMLRVYGQSPDGRPLRSRRDICKHRRACVVISPSAVFLRLAKVPFGKSLGRLL
jgi:hypothetical protein